MLVPREIKDDRSQLGAALVIAIMILLILTVLGIYAVTTATLETKIAGNERVLKDAFYAADGGIDLGRYVTALFLNYEDPTLPSGASVSNKDAFRDEVIGVDTSGSPKVTAKIGNSDVDIYVDRIKAEEESGSSMEFGAPVSEKKVFIYCRLQSESKGIAGASAKIEAIYRHVVH